MKLSTVLLSSAALLVAGAAYAADLPAKKAAPAAAPTGCAALGAGYIAVPGGDTCLKISGYVRSNNTYSSNAVRPTASTTSLSGAYGLKVEAAQNSDVGVIKSTIFVENNTTTYANVSFAGLTAGRFDVPFNVGGGYNHTGDNMQNQAGGLMYSAPLGGTTVSLAAMSSEDNNAAGVASRPDLVAFTDTKAGAFGLNLGVASHEVAVANGTAQGVAALAKVSYDAGVASFMGYAAYANGASKYLYDGSGRAVNLNDSDANAGNLSTGSFYSGEVDVPVGKNDSIGLYGENLKITQNTSSYSLTQYSVALKHTVAKGLWIRPEIYQDNENGTISNGAYIRIERDF
jgi:Porin subfamily